MFDVFASWVLCATPAVIAVSLFIYWTETTDLGAAFMRATAKLLGMD